MELQPTHECEKGVDADFNEGAVDYHETAAYAAPKRREPVAQAIVHPCPSRGQKGGVGGWEGG